jgi:hypothetical protein
MVILLLLPWFAHLSPSVAGVLWLFNSVLLVAVVIWGIWAFIGWNREAVHARVKR